MSAYIHRKVHVFYYRKVYIHIKNYLKYSAMAGPIPKNDFKIIKIRKLYIYIRNHIFVRAIIEKL